MIAPESIENPVVFEPNHSNLPLKTDYSNLYSWKAAEVVSGLESDKSGFKRKLDSDETNLVLYTKRQRSLLPTPAENATGNPTASNQTATKPAPFKKKTRFVCKHAGCESKHFNNRWKYQAHQRRHLNINPFSCTWPSCGFATVDLASALKHIEKKHLKQSTDGSGGNKVNSGEARKYVKVHNELLEI